MSTGVMNFSTNLAQSSTIPSPRRATHSARPQLLWLLAGIALSLIWSVATTQGAVHLPQSSVCQDVLVGPQIRATFGVARF
jgi:hypothetical protein